MSSMFFFCGLKLFLKFNPFYLKDAEYETNKTCMADANIVAGGVQDFIMAEGAIVTLVMK